MTQGFGHFPLLGLAVAVVLAVWRVLVVGSDVSFSVCKL